MQHIPKDPYDNNSDPDKGNIHSQASHMENSYRSLRDCVVHRAATLLVDDFPIHHRIHLLNINMGKIPK